jgi:hypothetical protein
LQSYFAKRSIAVAIAATLVTTSALARPASQMTDLVGGRAASGESQMEARGFTFITSSKGDYNTVHSYWWNSRDKNCLHVETYDGRYTAIRDGTNSDCHRSSGNGNAAAAVGAVAGIAILGALLSHKSHQKDDKNYNEQQTAEFERGYNDGLHNASYHNYNRSDVYSHGYERGVEQRSYNLQSHSQRGGYSSKDYIRGSGGLEQKCQRAVAKATGARVIGTNRIEESQAATAIYVNVQGANAPWMCLGYRNGTIGEVRFTGSEGAL